MFRVVLVVFGVSSPPSRLEGHGLIICSVFFSLTR